MDYAQQARLKVFAEIEVIDAADDPELIEQLTMPGYDAKVERAMVLHVTAYDWNCPQHITPRFTIEEIGTATSSLRSRIAELESEIEHSKSQKTGAACKIRVFVILFSETLFINVINSCWFSCVRCSRNSVW